MINKTFACSIQFGVESSSNGLNEFQGVQVRASGDIISSSDADGEILGHFSILNAFDCGVFEVLTELVEFWEVVKVSSVHETSGPGEDRGNGVSGGFFSLLMLSIMSSDCSVGGFSFNGSIRSVED